MEQYKKHLFILLVLVSVFTFYNFNIYTSNYTQIHLSKKGIEGENIWLQNNCNSCHQLYGLGGYLGPDLTNIYSVKGKKYVKIVLNSAIKSMPKFNFNAQEKEQLVQFLKEVDQTGYYPDVHAAIRNDGWVTIKNKTLENEEK